MQESLMELRTEIEVMRGASRDEVRLRAVQMRSAREARIEAVLGEWMPLPENMPPPPGGREFLRVRRRQGCGAGEGERDRGVEGESWRDGGGSLSEAGGSAVPHRHCLSPTRVSWSPVPNLAFDVRA
jgi:hypothetical protein